jgi:hypothetical protein
MDVTFREFEPFYGENTNLSSLFYDLDSPSMGGDGREGENDGDGQEEGNEASQTRQGDHQTKKMEIVIEKIPQPLDGPNLMSVEESCQEIENTNVYSEFA